VSVSPLGAWRTPGCSERCERLRVVVIGRRQPSVVEAHDPESHEAWGRTHPTPDEGTVTVGEIAFDFDAMEASVAGRPASLTSIETRILALLVRRAGRLVRREEVLAEVWGPAYRSEWHLLRVNVSRLRSALGGAGEQIRTARELGFTLRPERGPVTRPFPLMLSPQRRRLLDYLNAHQGEQIPMPVLATAACGWDGDRTRQTTLRALRLFQAIGVDLTLRTARAHVRSWARLNAPFCWDGARNTSVEGAPCPIRPSSPSRS
jgi:hypothetical protein